MDNNLIGNDIIVIYHAYCNDGFASAWVIRKIYPNAIFFPAKHGTNPPDVVGKDVFILDFSYKRPILLDMKRDANSLVVLDHHKTAEEDLSGLSFCVFDMNKSGATLTWEYFKDRLGDYVPWLVAYTEDRDLWKFKLPFSREINAALDSYGFDFEGWDALDKLYSNSCISNSSFVKEGQAIIRYQERLIDTSINHARLMEIDGYHIKSVNTSCVMSHVANRLAKDQPFGLTWYLREDGQYVHSLRSREDGVDVSEIAKRHGGGGHIHSAGFESKKMVLKEVNSIPTSDIQEYSWQVAM